MFGKGLGWEQCPGGPGEVRLFRAVGLSSQRTGHRGQGCRHRWAGSGGHRRLTGSAPKASEQGWGTWSFCVLGTLPWQLVRRQQSPEGQEPTAPEGHVPPLPCPTLILPSGPGASLLLRPRRRGPVSSPGPAAGGPSCHKSPRRQPGALPLGLGISPHATTCLGVRGRVPDGHHGFPVSNSHPLARESPFNSTICGAARGQIRRRIPGLRSATGLGQRDSNGEVQARGVLSPAAPLGLPGPPLSPLWALRMPKPRCPSAPRPGLDPPACPRASSLGTPPHPPLLLSAVIPRAQPLDLWLRGTGPASCSVPTDGGLYCTRPEPGHEDAACSPHPPVFFPWEAACGARSTSRSQRGAQGTEPPGQRQQLALRL